MKYECLIVSSVLLHLPKCDLNMVAWLDLNKLKWKWPCYDKEKDFPTMNMARSYMFDAYKSECIKVLLACVALSAK